VLADYRLLILSFPLFTVLLIAPLFADTPGELLTLSGAISRAFGGVVRLKNLFSSSLDERNGRFHLLSLMLTVVIDVGVTLGALMARPSVRDAVDAYVRARDPSVPPHRWAETTARARLMLESGAMSALPARLLVEVQVMLTSDADVRRKMHEVYKAYRAESAQMLWEDYARTAAEEGLPGAVLRDCPCPPLPRLRPSVCC
jgi:hypothetical protein